MIATGLQEAGHQVIIRKYVDSLYRHHLARWESDNLTYQELDHSDSNFRFNFSETEGAGRYIVKVPIEDKELDEKIQKLIDDFSAICVEDKKAGQVTTRPTPIPAAYDRSRWCDSLHLAYGKAKAHLLPT